MFRWPCPVCKVEFENSDEYFGHLADHKREMLCKSLGQEFQELNLTRPAVKLDYKTFICRWLEKK